MNIDTAQSNFFPSEISRIPISQIHNINDENYFLDHFFHFDQNIKIKSEDDLFRSNEEQGSNYFLDYIGFKSNHHEQGSTLNPNNWIKSLNQLGQSESEYESEEIQIPSTSRQKFDHISKRKVIRKSGSSVETLQESNKDDLRAKAKQFQNETKNLPKNFGKAIIAFALKNFKDFANLSEFKGVGYEEFKKELTQKRKFLNTIQNLKSIWTDFKYSKCMRVLSNMFLRRHALSYIFNSKISNITPHVKYRFKLLEAIKSPQTFTSIKDL